MWFMEVLICRAKVKVAEILYNLEKTNVIQPRDKKTKETLGMMV